MSRTQLRDLVFPRLIRARVERITLTGGEPFVHPDLVDICGDAVSAGLSVGICTNGTGISDEAVEGLKALGHVHVNVSLDGFRVGSHGRFRGDVDSFPETIAGVRRLSNAGLLQGLLSTPNGFTNPEEYEELAKFGVEQGAEYLLMNPLSSFGRGARSQRLAAPAETMRKVQTAALAGASRRLEVLPIRFPNDDQPLGSCIAGEIIYVFADGAVAVCPYLVFAARTEKSRHSDSEFIVGNVLNEEIARALDDYRFHERYQVGANSKCTSCELGGSCGKGCPAAVIAAGGRIGDLDSETCPKR